MGLSDQSLSNILPTLIFGGVAIIATLIIDSKICELKEKRKAIEELSDEKKIQPNETTKKVSGEPRVHIAIEGEGEEEASSHRLPPELEERHVLFVCMRCNYKKNNCETLGACKLANPDSKQIVEQDMEELASGPGEKTPMKQGAVLYHRLVQAHGSPNSPTRKHRKNFEIRPVRCLSTCEEGNSIAFQGPSTKFGYQFKQLDVLNNASLVDDILTFSDFYVTSKDGYTKNKTRPPSLKSTIASRLPPKDHYSTA